MPKMDDSRAVIKKPDASSVTGRSARPAYDPIELPSSFAFGKYSKVVLSSSAIEIWMVLHLNLSSDLVGRMKIGSSHGTFVQTNYGILSGWFISGDLFSVEFR